MLDPLFWISISIVSSIVLMFLQYRLYKISSARGNSPRNFWHSEYFFDLIKEIVLLVFGCLIAYAVTSTTEESKEREEMIKALSSFQLTISSEQKLNEDFIHDTGGLKISKEAIKNGENIINNLLENSSVSKATCNYLSEAGKDMRINFTQLQEDRDKSNERNYVERINSSYDDIMYLLALEIDYQQGHITEFNIVERYTEYKNSKDPDDPDNVFGGSGYRIRLRVRLDGDEDKSWKTNVNAQVGDVVEFLAEYRNISNNTQEKVTIKNIPPKNMEILSGSTVLRNSNHPNGVPLNKDAIPTQLFEIGNYDPNTNAYVSFKAKVVDVSLEPGSNTLVNWTQCSVGHTTIQDYACVVLNYEGNVS